MATSPRLAGSMEMAEWRAATPVEAGGGEPGPAHPANTRAARTASDKSDVIRMASRRGESTTLNVQKAHVNQGGGPHGFKNRLIKDMFVYNLK